MSKSQKLFACLVLFSVGVAFGAQVKTQKNQKVVIPKRLPHQTDKLLTIGSSDWHKSALSPQSILTKCDAFIAGLKGVSAQTRFVFQVGQEGRFGVSAGDFAVVDSHKFRANFGHVYFKNGEYGLHQGDLIADGGSYQKHDEIGWTSPVPISEPRIHSPFLSGWVTNFQEQVFAGLGTDQRPLETLLKSAKEAGLHVESERRTLSEKIREYRVYIGGKTSLDGVPTRFETEIIIDAATYAPLKITQLRRYGNRLDNQYRAYWAAKWNLSPNQTFDPSLFTVASKETTRAAPIKG